MPKVVNEPLHGSASPAPSQSSTDTSSAAQVCSRRGACAGPVRAWSGARDLNPRPHGPELCELSSRNVVNDRIQFDSAEAKSSPRPVRRCFARLLDEVLHDPPREDDLVWNRSWVEERPARLWKSRSLDRAFEPLG